MIADKKFKSFVIILSEELSENPSYTGGNGWTNCVGGDASGEALTTICYPANSREEAVELANEKLDVFFDVYYPMK